MSEAFIKLYKKMLDWEWYDSPNTCRVFLHCLLKANWKSGSWHGISYEPGQFITSLETLAVETKLSVKQVRVALDHLKMTGEVADQRQGNCRIITINNWGVYQGDGRLEGKLTADQRQTKGKLRAIDKEYKEKEEDKELKEVKNIYGEYRHVRLTEKERDRLFNDYGESETLEAIKFLDEYKERKGYKCKNDNLTLRKWVFDAIKEDRTKNKPEPRSLADEWLNA